MQEWGLHEPGLEGVDCAYKSCSGLPLLLMIRAIALGTLED